MSEIKDFPPDVQIETTNICNAKCIMCPTTKMSRPRGIMDFELFKKIIQQLKDKNLVNVYPFLSGEPFINPNFLEYLRYIRSTIPFVKINITTNGSLLGRKYYKPMIEEKLCDVLDVSVDAGSRDAHSRIRVGLNFDDVYENISGLWNYKIENNFELPIVRTSMILMSENVLDVRNYFKKWKFVDESLTFTKNEWAGQLQEKPKSNLKTKRECTRLNNFFTIFLNGDVATCCLDYEGKIILGNVKDQNIGEIWKENFPEIRRKIYEKNFKDLPLCQNCEVLAIYPKGTMLKRKISQVCVSCLQRLVS